MIPPLLTLIKFTHYEIILYIYIYMHKNLEQLEHILGWVHFIPLKPTSPYFVHVIFHKS